MSHPECNLKIEYKKLLKHKNHGNKIVGANTVRPSKKQTHGDNTVR